MGRPKTYPEQEMEEVRSPILLNPQQPGQGQGPYRQENYQTPYDITYQSRDNLSYYEVDGPMMAPPERDIGYASMKAGYGMSNGSTESFPTARPSGAPAPALKRDPTAASLYASSGIQRDIQQSREYTDFPVPSPVGVAK